jgi:hypothetical protein
MRWAITSCELYHTLPRWWTDISETISQNQSSLP